MFPGFGDGQPYDGHVSADEVYDVIAAERPNISRATVYRNLNRLAEMGKIRKIEVPGGADRFEHWSHKHYHVRCEKCGRIFDVDMPYMEDLEARIRDTHGFDFTVNFLYSVGGQVMDNGYLGLMGVPYAGVSGGNYHKDMLKAWTAENPDTDIPRAVYNDQNINAISDRFLIDGSSLTLKNASMGYTFPSRMMEKIKISSLRLYVSCDNIYYWSRRKGLDPRTSLIGDTDQKSYSPMRTISAGINVKF